MKSYFKKTKWFYIYFIIILLWRAGLLVFPSIESYFWGLYYIVFAIGFWMLYQYNIKLLAKPLYTFSEYFIYSFRIVAWLCIFIVIGDIILLKIIVRSPTLPLPNILLFAMIPHVFIAFSVSIIYYCIHYKKIKSRA